MINASKHMKSLHKSFAKMTEAMLQGNLKKSDEYLLEAQRAYTSYKEEAEKYRKINMVPFGVLNSIMENCVAKATVNGNARHGVGKCLNVIKEDKNLLNEARFFNALSEYDGTSDATNYVRDALTLVKENLDKKSMDSSRDKLAETMFSHNVTDMEGIDEAYVKFARDCDFLLKEEKKISNISETTNALNRVADYISNHKKTVSENKSVYNMCDAFDTHFEMLNESEKELVNDIINAKKNVNEKRQMKIFEKYQNECVKYIDKMMSENNSEGNQKLIALKEQILAKEYNPDTIVEDVAKFLEIGTIINS